MVEEETQELVRQERRLFFNRLAWYRRRVESLETQAVVDDLTGLRNQRALWRELTRRGGNISTSSPLTVLMLDFDMFNEVNQRYGHAIGDAVLRRAAAVIRDSGPSARLAFRYGGEEFVLLLPGDEEDGRAIGEQMRAEIASQNGDLPAVTVSVGVAQFDAPVEPWVALDRADAALRAAKRAGRNRVVISGTPQSDGSPYLVEELEQETARRAALALAVAALGERDRATADHSDDVVALCESVGRRLGLTGRELECLTSGAQLHDVGKVAVPTEILNKPGPLTEDEWAIVREHTVVGERILRSVPEMAEVATIVRHSHEHFDGTGYPDSLKGDEIPLASRVILCADAFHAIRSDRPYRRGRPAQEALAEIRAAAGTQLDPKVVAALMAVASDVREQKRRGTVAAAFPRKRRLVALLAALAILGGSAVAAVPQFRDALKSLFGAATAEPHVPATYTPGDDFKFGPLGDALSIEPAAVRHRMALELAATPRSPARNRGGGNAAQRRSRRGGELRGTNRRRLQGGASDGVSSIGRTPQAETGSGTPQTAPTGSSGNDTATTRSTPGRRRALGKTLPVPRPPARLPSNRGRRGQPLVPGRADPPAIGRNTGPVDPLGQLK